MPVGPGKYDELASYVREQTNALAVVVAVVGGNKGEGFSVQTVIGFEVLLPELLRRVADDIEASLSELKP